MKPIIEIENLSKKYRYGESRSYYTLRDSIVGLKELPNILFNTNYRGNNLKKDEFWALKDISLKINPGEVVGIIGSNGAGKSTLLKILCRITPPTSGKVTLRGRVGSLLEVGTGFQQELTGRENIYLNGAILGMERSEINRKFEEIVDFSGVNKFVDTPVKHYSSGMYMRLAFAVAANLDSDILIIDEVLAVGDSEFQKKCLGKMDEISHKSDKTILFVSHNMGAVRELCQKGLVLKNGKMFTALLQVDNAINSYQKDIIKLSSRDLKSRKDRTGFGKIKFTSFKITDNDNKILENVYSGQKIILKFGYQCKQKLNKVSVAVSLFNDDGLFISLMSNDYTGDNLGNLYGNGEINCSIDKWPFMAGKYYINLDISVNGISQDWVKEAGIIFVEDGDYFNSGNIIPSTHRGFIFNQRWKGNHVQ